MNKENAQKYIQDHLNENDSLIGFFMAVQPPKIWLFLLIGPLAILSMRNYFVAVTEKGIYLHKLTFLGKFSNCDFFSFNEIESVKIGKGLLQRPITFKFKNSRELMLKAQLKGTDKVAKITDIVQKHIENNILVKK